MSLKKTKRAQKKKQQDLFKLPAAKSAYGGELLKTRQGRAHGRPISTRSTMHLVLRSSLAVEDWSFRRAHNKKKISKILKTFSQKYSVKILKQANVGNHIHLHIRVSHRVLYKRFIRAVTSAITMAVTGASRSRPLSEILSGQSTKKFWDRRPYTRIIQGFRDSLNINQYIEINQLEACGMDRAQARYFLRNHAWGTG